MERRFFVDYACPEGGVSECSRCQNDREPNCLQKRPVSQFAFWTYTHYILHQNNPDNKDWQMHKTPSGRTFYKEDVNDFLIFKRGFGKGNALWNQLLAVLEENGKLNAKPVRINRMGSDLNTSWTLASSTAEVAIPEESLGVIDGLVPIREYFDKQTQKSLELDAARSGATNEVQHNYVSPAEVGVSREDLFGFDAAPAPQGTPYEVPNEPMDDDELDKLL